MITLNFLLFILLSIAIFYIIQECLELYHEEKLTKEFIKTLKDKGEYEE